MDELRRLKRSLGGTSSKRKAQLAAPDSADVQKKKKKQVIDTDELELVGDSITIRYPSSAHAYSEFGPHFKESRKLLWPEDKATFKELGAATAGRAIAANAFKCLQGVFHMIEEADEYEAELKKLRSEKDDLRSEVKSVKSELAKAEALVTERSEQLRVKELDADLLRSSQSENEALRAELFVVRTQSRIAVIQAEVKLRAEIYRQFEDGKNDAWDFEKAYTEERELQDMMASETVDPEVEVPQVEQPVTEPGTDQPHL